MRSFSSLSRPLNCRGTINASSYQLARFLNVFGFGRLTRDHPSHRAMEMFHDCISGVASC